MNRLYSYGGGSKKKIASGKHEIQQVCKEAMRIANSRKLFCPDFSIISVLRTAVEQHELYKKGRVYQVGAWHIYDVEQVVTYCDGYDKLSTHQSGLAIDFCAWVDGKSNFELKYIILIATCFYEACSNLGFDCDWGGSFKSISDIGHFEVIL